MALEVDAEHLPCLALVPVCIPVEIGEGFDRRVFPWRLGLEHGHDLMSTVAGHDLHDLHLFPGDPIHTGSARVVVEVQLFAQVFADVYDAVGINGGPKPPVRLYPGLQNGSREGRLD